MVAPVNDNFANATPVVIATDGGTFTSATTRMTETTLETGEPHGGTSDTRTAWWKYTPATSGTVSFDTQLTTVGGGTATDTWLGVYTGTAVNALTRLAFADEGGGSNTSLISGFAATGGVTYRVQVTVFNTSYNADVVLRVTGRASAAETVTGTLAASLPAPTTSMSGTYTPPLVTGSLAATLPSVSASLIGVAGDTTGTLTAAIPPLITALTGTYTAPITGTLTATVPALTATLTGALTVDAETDIADRANGRTRTGLAYAEVDPVLVEMPPREPHRSMSQSVPAPTLDDGRPQ